MTLQKEIFGSHWKRTYYTKTDNRVENLIYSQQYEM